MIIGIDKGTTYTKDNNGNIIQSTTREVSDEILLEGNLIVEFEEKKYIVGEKGNYSTDLSKAEHSNTRLLAYTIIGLGNSSNYIKTNVVLGLPIGLYSRNKDKMKNLFNGVTEEITINGSKKYIQVTGIEVFPEAAGSFYSQDKESALIIDLGGLSIDTALFEKSKLVKYSTYSMGTMKLYNKIANNLNGEYDLSLTEWDIPDILQEGLYIYGEKQKLNIEQLIKEHLLKIIERLKLEYDLKIIRNVLLTGGGSILLGNYIKKYIPQVTMIEPTFSNARGFYNVGRVIFDE